MRVILSSSLLLEVGDFRMEEIGIDEATEFAATAQNFCGHQTVKVLGIEPVKTREECTGYNEAIALKPVGRLEFGREYTVDEILEIGIKIFKISKK